MPPTAHSCVLAPPMVRSSARVTATPTTKATPTACSMARTTASSSACMPATAMSCTSCHWHCCVGRLLVGVGVVGICELGPASSAPAMSAPTTVCGDACPELGIGAAADGLALGRRACRRHHARHQRRRRPCRRVGCCHLLACCSEYSCVVRPASSSSSPAPSMLIGAGLRTWHRLQRRCHRRRLVLVGAADGP